LRLSAKSTTADQIKFSAEEATEIWSRPSRSLWSDAFRKLLRNRLAILGLCIVSLLLIAAVFGPLIAPYSYTEQNLLQVAKMPSREHWLGTDEIGRDLLSRLIYGARTATMVAVISTGLGVLLGLFFGIAAGYGGRWVSATIVRLIDITMSIPSVLLAAMISATLREPIVNWVDGIHERTGWGFLSDTTWLDLVIVFGGLSVVFWPGYARLIRGQILSLREKEYVEAARAVGAPVWRIALRHLLPNAIGPVIVTMTFSLASGMVLESSLSYLGIGVRPPQASWGNMIAANIGTWSYRPWLVAMPAAALAITTLGINFLGDGLNDALNPRSSRSS
jgi:peptide/nickel transport system permease protein